MRARPPPTFAQRLILYGLSIAAPVLVLCGVLVYQYSVERYRAIETETLAAAHELAKDLDSEIQSLLLLIETLSGILGPEMDLARLHRNATASLVPRGSHVLVYDVGGWQIMNTAFRMGSPLPVNYDPDSVKAIIEKNAPYVSDFKERLIEGQPVWIVSAPIRRQNEVAGLIAVARSPEKLTEVLGKKTRPPEWRWCLSDRDDIVLACSRGERRLVGGKMPRELTPVSGEGAGIGWVKRVDGTGMIRGQVRSAASGWLVSVVVPSATVEAPLREAWVLFGIGSTLLLTLALLVAASVARGLHGNVDILVDSAEKLGRGDPLSERTFSTREFQHIHDALAGAAAERQRSEERRHLLLRELQHRTNNLLAVISSITRRTLLDGRTMCEARDALLGRLQALANASDTLAAAHWQGADISLVIENEMRAFAGRYTAQGPALLLSAQAAQNISLVIHELATNASKHGALSESDGNVAIEWRVEGEPGDPRMVIEWKERGGPPAVPPARKGFGYTLLQTVLSEADSKPTIRFEPEGFFYGAAVRLSAVVASGGQAQPEASEIRPPSLASSRR
ncbi:MAG: sensor histidine kinase [Hyphomicrobiaceae bacterium]|nr:sensor histidine kinase [Hyphomicrobiaceae bacterium]